MKVAVYAIAKNEAKHIQRWLKAVAPADYVIVADTGSTDGTLGMIPAAKRRTISVNPFRFDDARNAALALVPADADLCISLDLDDVIQPGWRKHLKKAWAENPGMTSGFFTYDCTPGPTFLQNRIHTRNGFRWKYPCHEGLYPSVPMAEHPVVIADLVVKHLPDNSIPRNYLPLCELSASEFPHDARPHLYLGREYLFRERWEDAIVSFNRYFNSDDPRKFPAEIAQVCDLMAQCWRALK